MNVLRRGYVIAMKDQKPVTGIDQAAGDMTVMFHDGRAQVRVLSTERSVPFGSQKESDV